MKKYSKKEIFSIPNLMGYFRILMIPVFCWFYLHEQYTAAIVVVVISSLTDMFDGMVARKFDMVTELGKMLDPVADKLTHAALALCLAFRFPLMWALIALMCVKEGYMGIKGLKLLKAGKEPYGAMWYGKICTAFLFVSMIILFIFPNISVVIADALIIAAMVIMAITWILYIYNFHKEK